jgi:hypothetical protein
MKAAELVKSIRADLAPTRDRLLEHPYVGAVQEKRLRLDQLRPLAGEQLHIISSDLRSVAQLVGRFGGDFFLDVLSGERAALAALPALGTAFGMTGAELLGYEPLPGCQAYAAFMAWLAAYASDAEVSAAFVVNFRAWGENCQRLSRALRAGYGLSGDSVSFLDLFAETADDFEERALAVIDAGLLRGVPEVLIRRAPRFLQSYELLFWDTLYGALS